MATDQHWSNLQDFIWCPNNVTKKLGIMEKEFSMLHTELQCTFVQFNWLMKSIISIFVRFYLNKPLV